MRTSTPARKPVWNIGDRVEIEHEGVRYGGDIVSINLKTRVAVVAFDDGDKLEIELDKLLRGKPRVDENGDDSEDSDDLPAFVEEEDDGDIKFIPPKKGARGMHHYPISWSKDGIFFNCWAAPDNGDIAVTSRGDELIQRLKDAKHKSVHFYGWWRKTRFHRLGPDAKPTGEMVDGWAIDIYARIVHNDGVTEEYTVESVNYEAGPGQGDPRFNMHSLNSDICAAIRKWFFFEVRGDARTIRELRRQAHRPVIKVNSLRWLDNLLLKARETRDTALRSGGQRMIVIEPENEDEPVIALQIDFTDIAIANGGKVPSLTMGSAMEGAVRTKGKGTRTQISGLEVSIDPSNLKALTAKLTELNAKARQGDVAAKREAGKIRALMRKSGHRGGARTA